MSLKSMFLKDVPEETKPKVEQKVVSTVSSKPITFSSTISTPAPTQGVVDNKFIELLEGVLEQNSSNDQDYFKFKKAIENMKALNMDDKTKFQTVYAVLSLQGCKKELLLSSVDKYVSIINNEKKTFDLDLKNQYSTKVQLKLNDIEKSKKEVEVLTKKLSDLNSQILNLSQEAQVEEFKLKSTEENFKASADIIISEMNADKDKITNYL